MLARESKTPYKLSIYEWFRELSERLRYVRVVCGDWSQVCGGNWQNKIGTCGIFFDPPYSAEAGRLKKIYACESTTVAHDVRKWAIERGSKNDYKTFIKYLYSYLQSI